jgi:LysR family transcriptional regulator (chromosome initiation inhibitor)
VEFDAQQLRALAAIAAAGSLDGAARTLHVTPSAVSQRLRALESATGRVLVVRSRPVRLTPSGESLLRLAKQIALLEDDAARELDGGRAVSADGALHGGHAAPARTVLAAAVNADSLATWFLAAVAPLVADIEPRSDREEQHRIADLPSGGIELRIHREDEHRTGDLLRGGVVMAAVTTEREPVAGCRVTPLGAMRYAPVASSAFAERWFGRAGIEAEFARAPMVTFDDDDTLQHAFLRRRADLDGSPPMHRIPATADFLRAVQLGFGWGLVPELQIAALPADAADALVVLADDRFDVPLYWQQWSLDTASLSALSAAVVAAGRDALVQAADAHPSR